MAAGATNRLEREKSPYLRQHAEQPVDWYPWGEEAFAEARRRDVPVFLSIGYATCHWCHVMARESFADADVAALLNAHFVCVKVDREERPDIDGVYMQVCQALTGSGGWPLTVVLTPEKRPFFAATYIPRKSGWGRTGLLELIPRIGALWQTGRPEAEAAAQQTLSLLKKPQASTEMPAPQILLDEARREAAARFDERWGGFGEAPKFPMPHPLIFLLRHGWRTGDRQATGMAVRTLEAMRRGGIYDQLGYGFHRYSTDRRWLLPHFEKMLYDQALLALAYTEAFEATGEALFGATAREVIDYVLRDLRASEGAFYAAEDADSEGVEGRFYLWGAAEIESLIGADGMALFGATAEGNVVDPVTGRRTGENVLWWPDSSPIGGDGAGDKGRREPYRRRLLAVRAGRVRPQRDEKILTDWNGLMIAALARAARVFGEPRYQNASRRAVDFILARLQRPDGRLLHRFCDGEAAIEGHLDDYAFLIWGLLESYGTGFALGDLRAALDLQAVLTERFRDPAGGYFFTADDAEVLPLRLKEGYDGAVPSGNAVTLQNLIRFGRLTGDPQWEERAADLVGAFAGAIRRSPAGHGQWLIGLESLAGPSGVAVVVGRPGTAPVEALLAVLHRAYGAGITVLMKPDGGEEADRLGEIAPFTRELRTVDGRTTVYFCGGFACRPPVTDPEALVALIAAARNDAMGPVA